MKKVLAVLLMLVLTLACCCALADIEAADEPAQNNGKKTALEQTGLLVEPGTTAASAALPTPEPEGLIKTETGKLTFVSASRYKRTRKVT